MLSEPLKLGIVDASTLFDYLYQFFHRDFIKNKTHLNRTIYVNPQSHRKDENKEESFWHITTREEKKKVRQGNIWVWKATERYIDYNRASRIEWVKQIIENHSHDKIKLFYHKETSGKCPIRLYLWAHQDNFVVILQKLGKSSSYLVTSFYIDDGGKTKDYEARYQTYRNGSCYELSGCEWF